MSRTERLFDLIQLLRTYKYPVTAAKLARELEVTPRTVYRDIATLQLLGAPVEGEAGMGYLLRPGFLLPPLMFTEEEVESLALGARWVASRTDARFSRAARSALARISAVLPPRLKQEMEDTPLLIGPGKGDGSPDGNLAVFRRAIRQQRRMRISYRSVSGAPSERVVWPFALSFFDHARVLLAWCELRKDFRAFRVDLVQEASVLPNAYPRPRAELLQEWRQREGIPAQNLSFDS